MHRGLLSPVDSLIEMRDTCRKAQRSIRQPSQKRGQESGNHRSVSRSFAKLLAIFPRDSGLADFLKHLSS